MAWLKEPDLGEGESVVVAKAANRFQGSRAVGGKLTVTDRRLVFLPNPVDARLGGKEWTLERNEVASVGVEPRGAKKGLFGGGLRQRLRVRTSTGGEELFVINGLDETIDQLVGAGYLPESAEA